MFVNAFSEIFKNSKYLGSRQALHPLAVSKKKRIEIKN